MIKCDKCSNVIEKNDNYFESQTGISICKDCGEDNLTYRESIDAYTFTEKDVEQMPDDSISEVDIFYLCENYE